jgi:hypothetical protein
VLPGDDVVVLALMQSYVDAVGLVYICHVRQVKVLRSPGAPSCVCVAILHKIISEHSAREGRGSFVSLNEYVHG